MCSMLFSDPVSRLSTQMTRWPRRRSSSHRCDPRNPAPPVTRQVAMDAQGTPYGPGKASAQRRARGSARPRGLQLLLRKGRGDAVDPQLEALGEPLLLEPLADDGAALAPRAAPAAALLGLDELRHATASVFGCPNACRRAMSGRGQPRSGVGS